MKKKLISLLLIAAILSVFTLFALGSGEEEGGSTATDEPKQTAEAQETAEAKETAAPKEDEGNLGKYNVEIKGCRLVKTFDKKDAVIVTYAFTNYKDDATSFMVALKDEVFQNDIGLNGAYILATGTEYDSDSQMKDVRKGATLDVEVAYELNDAESEITVEVSELFSFDDDAPRITKTFALK